jgi:ABC-type glycerol-3-phosphate transport system substrate-binding protein
VLLKTSWTDPDWLNGKILFNETPVTQISQQLNYKFKVGFTRYPMLPGAKLSGVEVGPNMMFCVNSKTKHPEAVARLLSFLYTDPEGAKLMALERGVPTNKKGYEILVQNNMIDDVTKQAMVLIEATDTGRYTEMEFSEVHDELFSAIQKVGLASGGTTPEEAARVFMEKANRILKASK